MVAMKRGPIGVWISLALAILLLGLWVGSTLGSAVARYWYRHHQQEQGTLPEPERALVESELSTLSAIQILQLHAILPPKEKEPQEKYLLKEIEGLEYLKGRSNTQEIASLVDLDLGLAYVDAAMVEEKDNDQQSAKKHIQLAQAIFKSLGWQDYSEETLKVVVRRKLEKFSYPHARASGK